MCKCVRNPKAPTTNSWFWNKCVVYSVSFALVFSTPISSASASASVFVDNTASLSNRASVVEAGNGVPIVDIVKPTAKGVSHNKFTQLDINTQGIIFNNSRVVTDTQLAGHIDANPNLGGSSASIILNEVTGPNRSQLNGLAEIAGQSAELVLANPNGISCDGCGFINTPRATLATGLPTMRDGELQGFSIDGGEVSISRLNASAIDRLDIFARAITLNDELHAQRLNLITGRNDIAYTDLALIEKVDNGSDKPAFALDVASLGGMYANQIFMIGTESGVGVNMQGEIASGVGDISIKADGSLSINKIVSDKSLNLESVSSDIAVHGNTYSKASAQITASQGDIVNDGNIIAEDDLTIEAENLFNSGRGRIQGFGAVDARLDQDFNNQGSGVNQGAFFADGPLFLSANNIVNHGVLGGGDTVSLAARNTLENTAEYGAPGSVIFSVGDLSLYGQTIVNRQSDIFGLANIVMSGDAANSPAHSIRNSSATLESSGDLSIYTNEFVNHRQGLYNFDNTDYCNDGGDFCTVPVTNVALDYGFSFEDTLGDAWLIEELGDFVERDWADESDWDNLKPGMRQLYASLVDRVLPSNRDAHVFVGGDFDIWGGGFRNEGASISVADNLTANVTRFANVSRLAVMPAPYSWVEHGDGWLDNFEHDQWHGDYGVHLLLFSGEVAAGKDIFVNATEEINNGNQFSGFVVPTNALPDLPLPKAPSTGHADPDISQQLNLAVSQPFVSFLELPPGSDFDRVDVSITLPPSASADTPIQKAGSGLFGYTKSNEHSNTLIATKPSVARFVDVEGSDYLLNLLGLNPDHLTKRLGDGFYESRLIRQAIYEHTGSRFLYDGLVSDAQQYRYLMDGAAHAAKDLQLSIGVALTHAQIQNLNRDMVWLVEQEVGGEVVLVPTLYLANIGHRDADRARAGLTANNVILKSGGEISNTNTVSAREALTLHAQGDINNRGGTLEADTLAIVSEAGDFVHAVDGGKRANLAAEKELIIEVDGDMRLRGSEITTGGIARIDVGRDLTIESTLKDSALQGDYNWQEQNGVVSRNTVSQQRDGAQLTIGGAASIRSGRDLNLKAAELSVAGSAKVDVGRDVNIESLTNRTTVTVREKYTEFEAPKGEGRFGVKSPGLDSKKRIRSDIETTTHLYSEQESQFSVSGDLALSSGRDFTLEASSLEVEGAVDLSVDGNLTLHSKDSHLETTISTKDTYIRAGRSGSGAKARVAWNPTNSLAETTVEDSKEVVASNRAAFVAGGDMNIQARGNVLSQRSDLVGGDAVIASRGSIHNTDRAKIQTKDLLLATSGNIENSGGSSIAGEDLSLLAGDGISNKRDVSQVNLRGGDFISTAVSDGSNIAASGNLQLVAGLDIVNSGSEIRSAGNSEIVAGRNIIVDAVSDRERRAGDKNNITDETRHYGSRVSSQQNMALSADQSIAIAGSKLSSGGDLAIRAGGAIDIASVTDRYYRFVHDEDNSGMDRSSETTEIYKTTNVASDVSAKGDLSLVAERKDLLVRGSSVHSEGNINIQTGGKVAIEAVKEIYDYHHEKSSSKAGGLKSSSRSVDHYSENTVGSSSRSAGDTLVSASGDIRIAASGVFSEGDIDINSGSGGIYLQALLEKERYSIHEENDGDFKMSVAGEGFISEAVRHAELKAEGQLYLSSASGILAGFHQRQGESLQQSIDRLGQENPNLQWMQQLAVRDDVDWEALQEVYESWEYEHSGISTMGALVLQVVVAAALPGAGVASLNGIFGAGTVTAGSATAAAVNAGFNTMVSMASGSLIANDGDIQATLEELGSNASMRHLLVSSLSAGVGLTDAPATALDAQDILMQSLSSANPELGRMLNFVAANQEKSLSGLAQNFVGESMQYYARQEVGRQAESIGLTAQELNLGLMLNSSLGLKVAGSTYTPPQNDGEGIGSIQGFFSRDGRSFGPPTRFVGGIWDLNDSFLNAQGYLDAVSKKAIEIRTHEELIGHSLGAWRVNNLARQGKINKAITEALPVFDYPVYGSETFCATLDGICGGFLVNGVRAEAVGLPSPSKWDILNENHRINSVVDYGIIWEFYTGERFH